MRTTCPVVVVALLVLLSTDVVRTQPASDFEFDPEAFAESIFAQFNNNVMGFAFAVTDSDGIQQRTSGGFAQALGDGGVGNNGVQMTTGIYSGLGSVSKILSGIALLNLFDKHVMSDASVQEQLDMTFWDKLPQKWQDAYAGTDIAGVTYRQLLQHRSGFRIDSDGFGDVPASASGRQMQWMLAQDVNGWDIGARVYNNFNFAILKFLIPAIAYPLSVAVVEEFYKDESIEDFSTMTNTAYGQLYEKYMVEEIFPNAVDGPIVATCRPSQELSADQAAKHYASANAPVGGILNTVGNPCISQGSWLLRALDLARFARTYAFTNIYIGPTTRASLYDPNVPDDRLLYNFTVTNNGFNIPQSVFAYHGGTQENYRAALVALPYGFFGVGLVNSPEFSSEQVAQAILDAFGDAIEDTPPNISPTLSGTSGINSWWVSDVTVEWLVTDPESDVSSTTGCDSSMLTTDTSSAGQLFTCSATSGGGTASEDITIRRDATAPSASVAGVEDGDSFAAVDPPNVTCVASDPSPGSGIVDPGPAPEITDNGGGFFTAVCTADDAAGNTQDSPSVSYKLVSLDILDDEIAATSLNGGNQRSLLQKLDRIQARLDRGQIEAAVNQMNAFEQQVMSLIADGDLPASEGAVLLADIRILIEHYS